MITATFSIVARCPKTGDMGVATASKYLAVGAVVPWAEEGVGAVATQHYGSPRMGQRALALMRDGHHPKQALTQLIADDGEKAVTRQLALMDAQGRKVAWTPALDAGDPNAKCFGHLELENAIVIGNTLAGPQVLEAMRAKFGELEKTSVTLAWRLLAALKAGDDAGGDHRGKQSAAVLVVSGRKGVAEDVHKVNYRVDDHTAPIEELIRIYRLRFKRAGVDFSN
ncbi:MAG: DUF1028 domain-containing protein [Verrucomicrobia bacterium]|nr:DUF1028 domain-containing protein [Verrucomicrobiota bacterium]